METVARQLRDFGRGVTGALVFGMPFLFTMETWWLAWTLPAWVIVPSALAAVLLVLALVSVAGFRRSEERAGGPRTLRAWATEAPQIFLQSLLAAYLVLGLYGVVRWTEPWTVLARIGLLQAIALGLGAAVANWLLHVDDEDADTKPFAKKTALFCLGALFLILPLAPTEEVPYLTSLADGWRLPALLAASLLIGHLVLFELEFQGQPARTRGRTRLLHWGESFVVTLLALLVSFIALSAFGHLLDQPPQVWIQETIVLSLPASIGGSAARVVVR